MNVEMVGYTFGGKGLGIPVTYPVPAPAATQPMDRLLKRRIPWFQAALSIAPGDYEVKRSDAFEIIAPIFTTADDRPRDELNMNPTSNPDRDSNRDPITGEPGAHPIGTGVGAAGGGATGAAIGAIGGPVGMAVGAVIGAVAGGLAGKGVAEMVDPTAEDAYWEKNHRNQPYYEAGSDYSDYGPAYRTGYQSYATHGAAGKKFDDVETDIQKSYESAKGNSRIGWEKAKHATRAAWDRVERAIPGDSDHDGK